MGERKQAKTGAGRGQPFPRSARLDAFFNRADEREECEIEKEKQQHLRQTGESVLPKGVADEDETAAEDREPLIEKPADQEKLNPDAGEEEKNSEGGDDAIAQINHLVLAEMEVGSNRKERDGVEQRRKGGVIDIGPDGHGDIPAVLLQLADRQRPDVFRFPSLKLGDCAPDLRLIHRLRGREATKIVKED